MVKTFKGYYLPKSLEDIEASLEFTEKPLSDASILVPKNFTATLAEKIVQKLRTNRNACLSSITTQEIARCYDQIVEKWKNNRSYEKKLDALKYLPELTNFSPELIEYFQFRSIYRFDEQTIQKLSEFRAPPEVFQAFTQIPATNSWLRAYAGLRDKLHVKNQLKSPRTLTLITYLTPKNVPGFIESLGFFLGNIVKASVLVKTPSGQPLFAPLFAQSIAEVSEQLGETIAVMSWRGGDESLENVIFRASDVVSVVSGSNAVNSVRQRIDQLNHQGYNIKGCYHGGKFGFEVIAKEFLQSEATAKKIAGLVAIDCIAYEGYMCASPAFGCFIERGGLITSHLFALFVAEALTQLSKIIPQRVVFRKLRENRVAELLGSAVAERKFYTEQGADYTVVHEPRVTINPIGQNRLVRLIDFASIAELLEKLEPWKINLQTAGIAISNNRLFGTKEKIAEKMGRIGLSSLRVVGTVGLPRLGEAWDGTFPIYEYFIPDSIHWTSVNSVDITQEIELLSHGKEILVNEGVYKLK